MWHDLKVDAVTNYTNFLDHLFELVNAPNTSTWHVTQHGSVMKCTSSDKGVSHGGEEASWLIYGRKNHVLEIHQFFYEIGSGFLLSPPHTFENTLKTSNKNALNSWKCRLQMLYLNPYPTHNLKPTLCTIVIHVDPPYVRIWITLLVLDLTLVDIHTSCLQLHWFVILVLVTIWSFHVVISSFY